MSLWSVLFSRILILLFPIFTNIYCVEDGLPSFLIIGAQKSGTGALYEILRQHPQIVDRPGEIHFFDIFYDQGVDWYKAQYPKTNQLGAVRGDKSPYYLFHPLAPERAYALVPNAKLIVLLRNPVDRAYSQYWMNVRNKREPLSFYDAVHAEEKRLEGEEDKILETGITPRFSSHRQHSYLSRGCYINQLTRWLAYYPSNQMMIIVNEDLYKDPKKVLKEVLFFLNLPEYNGFNFKIGKNHSYPPMDPNMRKELSNFFHTYNKQLETLLDRKFNWDNI